MVNIILAKHQHVGIVFVGNLKLKAPLCVLQPHSAACMAVNYCFPYKEID